MLQKLAPGEGLPPDDLTRPVTLSRADAENMIHLGVVGDTYTVLVSGEATGGQFCLIDMHIPPGGGPPPHRHDFAENFTILEGELEATLRGEKITLCLGDTVCIPPNAPHQFRNASTRDARMLCTAAPAGLDEFFTKIGVVVPTRTAPPPEPDAKQLAAFHALTESLFAEYRTEILKPDGQG